MHPIKRRQFLQFAGATLATLGLSQVNIQRQGLRYGKVLAQNTPRKLALLVGINAYPGKAKLDGCLTDVELQKELLIHRFGFQPSDILTVTDAEATRDGMLEAFEEHLIKQAKPGDVVVYHFSGHGSQVIDPNSGFEDGLNSTFVPINRVQDVTNGQATVSDIMGASLFLLMSALQTDHVTVVLDSCHSGGGKRGNLNIRAIDGKDYYPSTQEQDYQQQWLAQLGLSPEEYSRKRQESIAKGIVMAGAKRDQLAADLAFNGFYAGAFTYLMTQYLWQETGNAGVGSVLANVSRSTTQISTTRQIPELEVAQNSGNSQKPTYLLEKQAPPAEGVIQGVQGEEIDYWLGGLNPQSLVAFDQGAKLAILDAEGNEQGLVETRSRNGLKGTGKLLNVQQRDILQPGTILQERARAIPKNLTLKIGLDDSLGNDASQARKALEKMSRIEPKDLGQGEIHYIFGRMTEDLSQELQRKGEENIPPVGSLGLYGQGLDLIPGSFGEAEETIEKALTRLQSKFRSLLAARVIKATLNADASQLKVTTAMKIGNDEVVANAFTARSLEKTEGTPATVTPVSVNVEGGIVEIPLGTQVQFEVNNQESQDLYVTVLVVTTEGEMVVVFPNSWTASENATLVKAKESRLIPDSRQDSFQLTVGAPVGTAEVLIIASATPLRDALLALQSVAASRGQRGGPVSLGDDSVTAIDDLLGDLHVGSTRSPVGEGRILRDEDLGESRARNLTVSPVRTVNTSQLAAMSITFRSVE